MMKRWMIVLALPLGLAACSNETSNEVDVNDEKTETHTQSKEERQVEIAAMEEDIAGLIRGDRTELLDSKADRLLKRYRDYISSNPRDSITAEYLFKAADLSVGVGQYKGAIAHLDRLNTDFPNFRRSVEMWLFKAYVYEVHMNDYAHAAETYKAIIEKYPNHRLADEARASIHNLGLSEEELIKKFEEINAEKNP